MIVYFTGTGNTAYCAQMLADELRKQTVYRLTPHDLRHPEQCTIVVPAGEKQLIWMTPVHSWGLPPVMAEVMKSATVEAPSACMHHLVLTCGDDTGLTARAWRKIMHERGFTTGAAFSVQMPNTYVTFPGFDVDKPDLEQHKIDMSLPRIGEIAALLRSGVPCGDDVVEGGLPALKSKVVQPLFVSTLITDRHFRVSDACIGCGRCQRVCPMANIALAGGRPDWHHKCTLCLACYHVCPQQAITYGSLTRGKGHYTRFLKR